MAESINHTISSGDISAPISSAFIQLETRLETQDDIIQQQTNTIQTPQRQLLDFQLSIWCPLTSFTLFPDLPIEIRNMVWKMALPGPRIIEVVSGYYTRKAPETYTGTYQYAYDQLGMFELHKRAVFNADYNSCDMFGSGPYRKDIWRSPTILYRSFERGSKPPALLHVSKESQAVATYTFNFCLSRKSTNWNNCLSYNESSGSPSSQSEIRLKGIRFQPSQDTFFVKYEALTDIYAMDVYQNPKGDRPKLDTVGVQSLAMEFLFYRMRRYSGSSNFRESDDFEDLINLFPGLKELFILIKPDNEKLDPLPEIGCDKFKENLEELLKTNCKFNVVPSVHICTVEEFKGMSRWGGHTGFEHI